MAGIAYYSIEQIPSIPEEVRIVIMGTIISVFKQQKYLTFNVSDCTSTAEATLYQPKQFYSEGITIPEIGDTIQILGTCATKPMATSILNNSNQINTSCQASLKNFLKIRIDSFRIIKQFDEQIQIMQKTISSRKRRYQKKLAEEIVVSKKRSCRSKQKQWTQKQMVDIRSLIFSYMYIVFSSNNDINSYLFMPTMVLSHRLSKQYSKEYQISQKSLEQAVKRSLSYLVAHQVIQLKQVNVGQSSLNNPEQYIVKKRYFERLIVEIEQFIYDKKAVGSTLQQVTIALNQKMGKHSEDQFMFNFKFIQKVLIELIHQHRIYKTTDKRLFPNSY